MKKINIVVFASGNGTNAEEIFRFFSSHPTVTVKGLLTNNPSAAVIARAAKHNIPCKIFNKAEFADQEHMLSILNHWDIDGIILAGFLWLIPVYLIEKFPDKILNIHPALLPKFGGKGMYGMRVHQAVLDSGEPESGITIHLVNREYDRGRIIFQKSCPVDKGETPESLASKIHVLEHRYYPSVAEQWLLQNNNL